MTGLRDVDGHSGVQTFKKRQSSLLFSSMWPPEFCAQGAPKAVASRTPLHDFTDTGSRHRKSPNGGCANGMPLKTAPPSFKMAPRIWPPVTATVGPESTVLAGTASTTMARAVVRSTMHL